MALFIRILIPLLLWLALDLYAYQAVRTAARDAAWAKYLYWGLSLVFLILLVYILLNFDRNAGPQHPAFKWLMGSFVLLLVPKLFLGLFLLSEDLLRILVALAGKFSGAETEAFLPSRRRFVSQVALGVAAIPFAGILHGIWQGRYRYRVIKETLYFPDLPAAFDGLRITQISDIHSGSFDNREKIRYGVELIQAQKSDLLVFTGDLVNNTASEIEPWKDLFAGLQAPLGKFSILGNHDYGDYVNWPSAEAKKANLEELYQHHADMGFRLLRNEGLTLSRDDGEIHLLGVENWGTGGFPQYGDIDQAARGLPENGFNLLLSHDPSHFDHVVKKHPRKVHLTLSGHTHGMQFGIEIPGFFRWSPVKYRYPKWAGLYQELGRYLYVNRGFGYLAFPGRVGIWPEITVLELRKSES